MGNHIWYFSLGFTAQLLFSARMLIQWIMSEKAKKVVSPTIFWQLSLLGSFLFFMYGWLRGDFAIVFGQIFSYYIYIWNLNAKNHWKDVNPVVRYILILTPIVVFVYVLFNVSESIARFSGVPLWLLIFGSAGQVIFTFRFVYQWWCSKSKGKSILPANFWLLSLLGSSIIIVYGIYRKDPILIVGQSTGFIIYFRNLWLSIKK